MKKYKTPAYAVFSGGGAQGIALAGAYQAALDSGFEFRGFGGTSAGAMIAIMAASGMSGDDIVQNSTPDKDGHPSKFFSDPPNAAGPERRLARVLREWSTAFDNPKGRQRSKRLKAKDYKFGTKVKTIGTFTELLAVLTTAVLVAGAIVAALWSLFRLVYPQIEQHFLTFLPELNLADASNTELVILTLYLSAFILLMLIVVLGRFGRFPVLEYLFVRPRGKYWRWILYNLRHNFGFLRGIGMERAFNALLAPRIAKRASAPGKEHLATRLFSTLTFVEFEELFECPIKIVASDLWSGKPIVFDSHSYPNHRVFEAVRASTAFPLAFEPVRQKISNTAPIKQASDDSSKAQPESAAASSPDSFSETKSDLAHVLVDGGLSSNSPAFLFKRESDFSRVPTIAFQLNYSYPGPRYPENLVSYMSSLTRTAVGAGDTIIQGLVPRMHVVSVTGLEEYGVLDGDLSETAVNRLFELGRARHDDMVRIWKICRIAKQERLAVDFEYKPLMDGIHQALTTRAGAGLEVTSVLWIPDDYAGRCWRMEHVTDTFGRARLGETVELPVRPSFARTPAKFKDQAEADALWEVEVGRAFRRLNADGKHLSTMVPTTLLSRDIALMDIPGGVAAAFPVFAHTIEPETWLRGQDIVGVVAAIAIKPSLTEPNNDSSDVTCGWIARSGRVARSSVTAVDPSVAREMKYWTLALGRFLVA